MPVPNTVNDTVGYTPRNIYACEDVLVDIDDGNRLDIYGDVYLNGARILGGTTADVRSFGVKGDGVTNDTAAVQAAFTWAVSTPGILTCPPGLSLLVDPLTVSGSMWLEGVWRFVARTINQAYVLSITGRQIWENADIEINCNYKALYGIRASGLARSKFGRIRCDKAQLWGFQFDPVGNNSGTTCTYFGAQVCGTRHPTTLTQVGAYSGALTSLTAFSTLTLTTPLLSVWIDPQAIKFIVVNSLAYKVLTVDSTTQITVQGLDLGAGGTASANVLVGGGLNIPKYGDNGVGHWLMGDIACYTIGVHIAALYGWCFDAFIFQECGIGIACDDYTTEVVWNKPYFENNLVDVASFRYMKGTIISPVNADWRKMQNCQLRIASSLYGYPGYFDAELTVLHEDIGPLSTRLGLGQNTSARTLKPGWLYSNVRSVAGDWTVTIDNSPVLDTMQTHFIELDVNFTNPAHTGNVILQLLNPVGVVDTIEGGASYSVPVSGRCIIKVCRVLTDWKVVLIRSAASTAPYTIAGSLDHDGTTVGFNGATPVVKAANPGTASGADAAVLNAVVTVLRNLGLVT